jgi:DNA-binding winged helix-turn-helix (wHTH) protein
MSVVHTLLGSVLGSGRMKLAFGDCILDLAARQLLRGGDIVPLEPKMYQLLEVLIRRRPAVVTNTELDEILWPQVYVARTSLTRLVSELRSVLGDTPRDSRIIRTSHKIGYAFCASVRSPILPERSSATIGLEWKNELMPLTAGEHIAGRGAECSLVINAVTVSRRHARITVLSAGAIIEDLDSTNGTHVNGTQISAPTRLSDRDQIELGRAVLLVRMRDPMAPTVKVTGDQHSRRVARK